LVCLEGQLSADELNSLIAHAHRRIEQLERQLAEQRTAEHQRVNVAVSQLREENRSLADERLRHDKEQMSAELEMLKRQWVLTDHSLPTVLAVNDAKLCCLITEVPCPCSPMVKPLGRHVQ